jgi:hypothetical protein
LCAAKIIEDNAFNSNEQQIFNEMFGQELLDKLKNFLSGHQDASSVQKSVSEKLDAAVRNLQGEIPVSFENEMAVLEKEISSNFV